MQSAKLCYIKTNCDTTKVIIIKMCDIQHTKAWKWLFMSLMLLFAVLPANFEARPRVTTNYKTNLLDSAIPTGQENDQEEKFIKPFEPEETNTTTDITTSKNNKSQILIAGINQTHSSEITTEGEGTFQTDENVEVTDYPIDDIQTSTFKSVDITSNDNIGIPYDFPSEKNNLFTILYATDFPILTRKLRGENLGYFQNPIESTDSTYSHIPIEFPMQAHSGIQILHSKDHPVFSSFFKNGNERNLDLDLVESSVNVGEECDDQENSFSTTTESVTGFLEVNIVDTTEPTLITDTPCPEAIPNANSDIFKQFTEPNPENQLEEKNENKTNSFSDEFILTAKSFRNIEDVFNTSSQNRSYGISSDERVMYTTKIMEIKPKDFLNTPSSEETTISTVPQESILKSENAVLYRTFKDDSVEVSSLTQNPLSLNPEKLIEEVFTTTTEDIRSTLSTEHIAFTTYFPEFQSVDQSNSENSLKTNADSKMQSEDFSAILSVKDSSLIGDGNRQLSKHRLFPVFQALINSEADLRLTEENSNVPTEKLVDVTVSKDEIFLTKKELDGLTEITLSINYPENSSSERSISSSFESSTLLFSPDLFELKKNANIHFEEQDEYNFIDTKSREKLLSGDVYMASDLNSENRIPLLRISVAPSIDPVQNIATIEELETKHALKISEEKIRTSKPFVYPAESKSVENPKFEKVKMQNTKIFEENIDRQHLGIGNNFQNNLQNISEISKTKSNGCCTSVNEKETKIISEDTDTQNQVLIPKTKPDEEQIEQTPKFSNYETTQAVDYTNSTIPIEESNAQKNYGERKENYNNNKIKVHSFQSNDDSNLFQPEISSQKQNNDFAVSKEAHSIKESSQSEKHVNQFDAKETVVHLNRPKTQSSESVESYETSYFLPDKKLPSRSIYEGRAFPDASEYFTEHLHPFKETSVEKSVELFSTDHRVIKKPGALDTTLFPLLFPEGTTGSSIKIEGTQSSRDYATSTTALSFTEIIVEAAELTTELNHEIESFRTTAETLHSVLGENVAAIGSTFSAELDTYNLGDALPTNDVTKTVAADISLSIILMICMVGIFVVLGLLVIIWYKMRNSGNTFDIQLEDQRHRKEPDSQSISVSK